MFVFFFLLNCSINKYENIRWRLKLSVFDVAAYILQKCGDMSCMKLQKLCYYAQAWSLVWDDAPLFDEDFEAWASGPVCPELFHRNERKFIVSASDEHGNGSRLSDNQIWRILGNSLGVVCQLVLNLLTSLAKIPWPCTMVSLKYKKTSE